MKKIGLFGAGVLFGTVGLKILGSKDAPDAFPWQKCTDLPM